MNETGISGTGTAGILILAGAVASFLLFLAAYRVRVTLWLGAAEGDAQSVSGEVSDKRRVAGGLYLLEMLVVAAFCFLLTLSLRVIGLSGAALTISSLAACSLAVLVVAPFSVRIGRSVSIYRHRPSLLSRLLLRTALFLRDLSLGRVKERRDDLDSTEHIEGRYERDLFEVLSRLRDRYISEVMIGRVDMVCADECSTISELAELVRESGHTKIPIFAGTIDSITGYVTAKDVVLRMHRGGGEQGVSSISRPPAFVASGATIEHTLKEMQRTGVALAIINDHSGATAGLVTSQDILEEIVGDLYEDYEPEEPAYRVLDEKTALVRGNVKVGDLQEIFEVAAPASANRTLGEYVRDLLGPEAGVGDQVSDDVFSYRVVRMTGKTVWSVRVEKRV